MRTAARLARWGDRILSLFAAVFILMLLLYGGYSIWDTHRIHQGAFVSDALLEFKPTAETPDNPILSELQKINPDIRAWLTIDDTHIDYPVVQGKNDMDYINKDVYGGFSLSGAIFLDSRNQPDFSDKYSLVYGHHMENGAMFGDVAEFTEGSCFENHTSGMLYLPDMTYKITLFACTENDAYDSVIYNPERQDDSMEDFLDHVRVNPFNIGI